ncbi:MAG: hypothetical protein ACRED2_06170 [Methylocella sp.]
MRECITLIFLAFIVNVQLVALADDASPSDLKVFALWRGAVIEEFKAFRTHEDDALTGMPTINYLAHQQYNALLPPQEIFARLQISRPRDVDATWSCRAALIGLKWLVLNDRPRAASLYDRDFIKNVQDYVGDARRCENGLKLKPMATKLRELADATDEMAEPEETPRVNVAGRLPLSQLPGGDMLVDMTIDYVFRQAFRGNPESRLVVAYAAPSTSEKILATVAFLARSFATVCRLDRIQVLLIRNDLPWKFIKRDAPRQFIRLAEGSYDPRTIVDSKSFDVMVATRVAPRLDVEMDDYFWAQEKLYTNKGYDDDKVEALTIKDMKKKYRIGEDWRLPAANDLVIYDGKTAILGAALFQDATLNKIMKGMCDDFDGQKKKVNQQPSP